MEEKRLDLDVEKVGKT